MKASFRGGVLMPIRMTNEKCPNGFWHLHYRVTENQEWRNAPLTDEEMKELSEWLKGRGF